ncbi:MAG: hypothetical protein FJ128_04425 [Deltaproteobacteria bacterium]|nr:hypothetical protein [Deltaproteobacteria bacterium]
MPALHWGPLVCAVLGLLAAASPALAHRLVVFAYAEGRTIHTESKFVPDTPVRGGQVQVLDRQTGAVLLTGTTDEQGKFSFTIPDEAAARKMDLRIVVEAGMGHQGEWLLKAERYLPGLKPAGAAPPPAAPSAAEPPGAKAATLDQKMLEEALTRILERQLTPMREMLAEMSVRRTSLPDIIGGLGYIMGIFGLWAYFQSRGKKNP